MRDASTPTSYLSPGQRAAAATPARAQVIASALAAALLGATLLWGAGFSPTGAVHDAAHDARHSNGFPCH